jgi:ATP-binding cassette subfamily B protein
LADGEAADGKAAGGGFKLLLGFMATRWPSYALGFALMFAASWAQSWLPKILGSIIDALKSPGFDRAAVLAGAGTMLAIAAAAFVLTYFWRTLVIGNARRMDAWLRERLYRQFLVLSPEFYSLRKTGDLIAYAINDISAVRMAFGPATAMSVNGLFACALAVAFMAATVDLRLTLLSLCPVPFVVWAMLALGGLIQRRFGRVQEIFGAVSDRVQENINGIRVIKAYVQEESEIRRFEGLNAAAAEAALALARPQAALTPAIEGGFAVSFALALVVGGGMALRGEISVGLFVAFNTYLAMATAPMVSIGRIIGQVHKGLASLRRLETVLDVRPAVADRAGARPLPAGPGRLDFKDLSFRYPGARADSLSGIDLEAPAGAFLGVVGKTGSGKSTLAALLLRHYDPPPGTLFVDGLDVLDCPLADLRTRVATAPQEVFLFAASIGDNLRFFGDGYTQAEVEAAARAAGAHDFVAALPDGYASVLGERGVNLSGGQKQRLAIARAVLADPAVLVLDDALSAVDALTEAAILAALAERRRGRTTVVITHRVSCVAAADLIVVLDSGRIAERGRHAELLAAGGLYAAIARDQARSAVHAAD